MFSLFRSKKKREIFDDRINNVYAVLTNDNEGVLTELELVQVLNNVRMKLNNSLKNRKIDCLGKATELNQRANAIQNAIDLIK